MDRIQAPFLELAEDVYGALSVLRGLQKLGTSFEELFADRDESGNVDGRVVEQTGGLDLDREWPEHGKKHLLNDCSQCKTQGRLLGGSGGSGSDHSEQLETCCICLDALSTKPVVMLMHLDQSGFAVASCPHYMHNACIERLAPPICPLCRTGFQLLSEPFTLQTISLAGPGKTIRTLCLLDREHVPASHECLKSAPSQAIINLLAATMPIPVRTLWNGLHYFKNDESEGIDSATFSAVLDYFRDEAPIPGIGGLSKANGFLSWTALKFAGASGSAAYYAAICGTVCVVCVLTLDPAADYHMILHIISMGAAFGACGGWGLGVIATEPEEYVSVASAFTAGLHSRTGISPARPPLYPHRVVVF